MNLNQSTEGLNNPAEIAPIIQRWMLRILIPLAGHRELINTHGIQNDELAIALSMGCWVNAETHAVPSFLRRNTKRRTSDANKYDPKAALAMLRAIHADSEVQLAGATVPAQLRSNVEKLGALVGLSEVDQRIIEFAALLHTEHMLETAAHLLEEISSRQVPRVLGIILGLKDDEVRASLDPANLLKQSGILCVDRRGLRGLHNKLDLLSDTFADLLVSTDANPIDLLRGIVSPVPAASLSLNDYPHMQQLLNIASPYLRQSLETRHPGVNVFLYGTPGSGKTQLARAVADGLACELFEVASEDRDGDPISGELRLRALRVAHCFFAKKRAILLFDEVEDVFNDGHGFFGKASTAQTHKAWINRTLEGNSVPTIWVSNSCQGVDPAFMRRFDIVAELPLPPKNQRAKILRDLCGDVISESTITRLSEAEKLAPAVVAKSAAVVKVIRGDIKLADTAAAFELLINNTLEAQGHQPLVSNDPNRLPETYDPCFIHSDADLAQVAHGLGRTRSGRICLYGPPGTGKTAFGRWLAEQLGVQLLIKRASDLKSMWLGECEKNIARAFRQAQTDGAVLLIDEVDSFLQDRRGAQRSWEVSEVNEMLTQMESFPGVFIASTNLMEGLDQAALRRFDLKVKFDYLRPEQSQELLQRHCAGLMLQAPNASELTKIARLQQLTPGDFAAVVRQSRFRPIADASMVVEALVNECALKEGQRSAIGFV